MRKTFETPGAVTLEIEAGEGSVEIETVEGTQTEVELDAPADVLEDARIELRERGGEYRVIVKLDRDGFRFGGFRLGWRSSDVRIVIRTPHGAGVELSAGSADVEARGRFGRVECSNGSGDIDLGEIEGDVRVKSGSGDLRIGSVGGEAAVQTGSGDVEIDVLGGPAKIRSGSGDLHVREAAGGLVAQTASGDLDVGAVAQGSVTLQSASGDISVGVRRGSRVWLDVKSMSGDAASDLEVGDAPVDEDGPLVELRATAMSGDISVRRA